MLTCCYAVNVSMTTTATMQVAGLGSVSMATTRRKPEKPAENEKPVRITTYIPRELAKRLKVRAAEDETTIAALVTDAIERLLSKR